MTPKQRSAHRNAQRSRLKGRASLLAIGAPRNTEYDRMFAQYVTTGRASVRVTYRSIPSGLFYKGVEIFWDKWHDVIFPTEISKR